MEKLLILAIDGMDAKIIDSLKGNLKNIENISSDGSQFKLISTFPPDSDTAWATIYTGLDPSEHGIVKFVDPLERVTRMITEQIDNSILKGNTFWDSISCSGKKICVIFPHIAYPSWDINGVMISRSMIDSKISCYPIELSSIVDTEKFKGLRGIPNGERDLLRFKKEAINSIQAVTQLAFKIINNYDWDLLFVYYPELDWIEHFFWTYHDKNDPSHKNIRDLSETINEFYIFFDDIIGEYMGKIPHNTIPLIISDHGHGMRPVKIININELLRRNNLLFSNIKRENYSDFIYILEKFKKHIIKLVNNSCNIKILAKFCLRHYPESRRFFSSPISVDWSKTLAYASDQSGIKAYSYGGVKINTNLLSDKEYAELKLKIINILKSIKNPEDGSKNLFKYVISRDELYNGAFTNKFPDVLFLLDDEWGAGSNINCELFEKSTTHNIVPGSHKIDSAVFILGKKRTDIIRENEIVNLKDIKNIIIRLMKE